MITVENGNISSVNYKEPKYSIPTYHLDRSIKSRGRSTEVTIVNDLDINITAHFELTLPVGDYTIEHGTIVLQREANGLIEYYVETEVAHNSELIVIITKQVQSSSKNH